MRRFPWCVTVLCCIMPSCLVLRRCVDSLNRFADVFFSEEFAIYMNYVRKLGFEETPDYDFLRELFSKVLKTLGEPEDGIFDWMLLNNGKGWEAGNVCSSFFSCWCHVDKVGSTDSCDIARTSSCQCRVTSYAPPRKAGTGSSPTCLPPSTR